MRAERGNVAGLGHGHPRVHEPRAGPRRDRSAQPTVGCLQPGGHSLLPAHGRAACPEREGCGVGIACGANREVSATAQLDPAIDRTLEAVCLKAMALEPADRYTSAQALADDIERWMADEPATALKEGWLEQALRWSRRHRSATRAAAASLLVIATVATLAALLIGREQSQTQNALTAEKRARQNESKARELAQEQSQLALDAIREYNTGVTREFLLKQPGMENLRKSLLEAPIRFYRRLAQNIEQNGITDPTARARLGEAQLDLGELINEIGMVDDSVTNFEQARDNIERVVREVPGIPNYRFLLARARCFLANRYDKASRPADARRAFDQAVGDFELLARGSPDNLDYRAKQAEALQLRADFLWDHGDLAGSRVDYLASIAIGAALFRDHPEDLEVMDKHASSLNNVSILFGEAGESQERTRVLEDSTALRERLVAATPADDPRRERFVSNLGSCYGNLGSASFDDAGAGRRDRLDEESSVDPGCADQNSSQFRRLSRAHRCQPRASRPDRGSNRSIHDRAS